MIKVVWILLIDGFAEFVYILADFLSSFFFPVVEKEKLKSLIIVLDLSAFP